MGKVKSPSQKFSEKIDFMERENILSQLEKIAEDWGLNVSAVVRIAVREFLKKKRSAA